MAFYIASNLIQKDSVKEKIHNLISKKVGGDVNYESMNLYFFHWPHVAIKKAEISIPGKVEGSFDSILVYPKILPLLYGNVEVSELRFNRPQVTLNIPEKSDEEKPADAEPFSFDEHKEQLVKILDYLNSNWKGFDARIDYGNLIIKKSGEDFLNFNNLNAVIDFPSNSLNYRVYANSNISQTINLKGAINTKAYDAKGLITLNRFKPHMLLQYLSPDNKLVSKSNIDLDLNYKSKALDTLQGNLVVSNSEITISKGKEEFQISGNKIDTDIHLDENEAIFNINNIHLFHPDVKATGKHRFDRKNNRVELNLYGNDIDVESSRDAVLFVVGGDRIVDLIFNIVRGGTIPQISLQASGEDFKDMWKGDNFKIKGNMTNGRIFIPYGDFDLTDVSGDALIGGGELKGTNLRAKSGNSSGHDGTFIIGLEGPIGPLHLDISVDADASEIPSIIKKFVDDQGFLYELSLIENLKGTASGKLNIGEMKKSPKVGVYVSELDIVGDYKRVPEPVSIKGNEFQFIDKSIDFKDLNIKIGNFASPQTTGFYHWKNEKFIELNTKQANIDLGVLFPWLNSFGIIKPHLRHIESMAGSAFFSAIGFTGPVSQSDEWEINATGNVKEIDVNLEGFGSVMTISKAEIQSSLQEMTLSNAAIKIKDSVISAGAVLNDYFRDNLKFTLDFYGDMLADEAELFSNYFSVPESLTFKSPISVTDSSLVVQKIPSSTSPTLSDPNISKTGNITKELDINMNVVAESLEWADSKPANDQESVEVGELTNESKENKGRTSLNGKVLVKSDNFLYKGFNWDTVGAEVAFLGDKIDVNISEANLCGVATPGLLEITSPTIKLQFETLSENESLADAVQCLFDKAGIIAGDFDLGGTINSNSDIVDVMTALEGELELTSNGGRVSKYGGLARFFSVLNFGEIFRGNNIDYEDEGFPYDFITASAYLEEGKLMIKEAAMDGPSLKVVCDGSIDLINEQYDLKVLVIPVLAVDSVIEKIPLIGALLGKDVVSIPIKITGDFSDPQISQLSPHTIGAGLLGIVKQTLNIPVTLVKPLDSGKKKKKAESETTEESVAENLDEKTPEE